MLEAEGLSSDLGSDLCGELVLDIAAGRENTRAG